MVTDGRWRSWGRRRFAGAALLLLLAGVVAVATAAASTSYSLTPVWLGSPGTPTTIAEPPPCCEGAYDDGEAATAASADGDATAAWIDLQGQLVVSSLNRSTGAWSTGEQLGAAATPTSLPSGYAGPTDAPDVAVAMDAAGDGVVAWWTGSDVDYSYELGGGSSPSWSVPTALGVSDGGNVYDVQVAMNSGGDAAIAVGYGDSNPVALATGKYSGGSFGFGVPVSITQPSGGTSTAQPQVVIDGAGDVLAAWIESGSGNPEPYVSFQPAGSSTPSTATAVSAGADASLSNGGITLAMNATGEAAIAWSDGTSIHEADASLAQLETSGGPQFDAAGTVTPDSGETDEMFPGIALSDDGTTALAWNDLNSENDVDAIIRPATGFGATDWSDTADLLGNTTVCSGAGSNDPPCGGIDSVIAPQVAFEHGDNAVVLWGGPEYGIYSVTSVGDSFASLSSASELEYGSSQAIPTGTGTNTAPPTNTPYNGSGLSLATDGVGDAVASWITVDGSGDYQPAVEEMDGAGTSFGIPATVTVNTPATFTASSPWQFASPAPSTSWDFGDGGTASGSSVPHTYTTVGSHTVTATTTDGNGAENIATSTINVVQESQSISFAAPGAGTVGGGESLSASGGGSGKPVVFSVDPSSSPANACSVSGANGSTVSFAHAGSCVIDANQAGNSDYSAAPQRSQTISVSPAPATTTTTATTTTPTTTTTPPPVLGKSTDVSKTSGTIEVELPGTHTFVTVSSSEQIPFGAVIDATQGTVTATIALPGGGTSAATFWAGEFTLSQSPSGALTATLVGGSFAGCPSSKRAAERSTRQRSARDTARSGAIRKKPGSPVRSLWSNAKGNFTTKGQNGAAAVLGTTWLTRDQCDGTYFYVKSTSNDPQGAIEVTVLHPHRHRVKLKRGHSLLAPAPGFS